MGVLTRLFALKSLRQRYLFLGGMVAISILIITVWTTREVDQRGQTNTRNIEQRIELAELSHQLRQSVVSAANMLDLFLLYPQTESREEFFVYLAKARDYLGRLETRQAASPQLSLAMLRRTGPLLDQLETAAVAHGMITRWQRAADAVQQGLTSPAEVRRVLAAD